MVSFFVFFDKKSHSFQAATWKKVNSLILDCQVRIWCLVCVGILISSQERLAHPFGFPQPNWYKFHGTWWFSTYKSEQVSWVKLNINIVKLHDWCSNCICDGLVNFCLREWKKRGKFPIRNTENQWFTSTNSVWTNFSHPRVSFPRWATDLQKQLASRQAPLALVVLVGGIPTFSIYEVLQGHQTSPVRSRVIPNSHLFRGEISPVTYILFFAIYRGSMSLDLPRIVVKPHRS